MMIKSKFYKQNGDEFLGLSAVLCKKKDLEGKILQGLFSEKFLCYFSESELAPKHYNYSHSNVLFDYHVFWASDSHFHALLSHLSQWSQ